MKQSAFCLILLGICLLCPPARAEEASSARKAALTELMNALSLPSRDALEKAEHEHMKEMKSTVIQSLKRDNPGLSAEVVQQINADFDALAKEIADENYSLYYEYFGKNMTEDDMAQISTFMRSPAGKKYITSVSGFQKLAKDNVEKDKGRVLKKIVAIHNRYAKQKP